MVFHFLVLIYELCRSQKNFFIARIVVVTL